MKSRIMTIAAIVAFLSLSIFFSIFPNADADNDPIYIDMVFVEGGTFTMGCTPEQGNDCESLELPAHGVTLSDFYIGKYEVTQAQWKAVMGDDNNPSEFRGDDLPVDTVSWYDIQEFIYRLNGKTGKNYRLPTEAEWEYAARGGNQSLGYKYSGSDDVNEVAWYVENSGYMPHPVGSKKPNELGIYDMSGNAGEWVSDFFTRYTVEHQVNPQGEPAGNIHMIRGGGWNANAGMSYSVRVWSRPSNVPGFRSNRLGFRLAHGSDMTVDDPPVVADIPSIANPPVVVDKQKTTLEDAGGRLIDTFVMHMQVYIEISTPEQLNNIRNNLSENYRLTADISLASYGNWEPIGTPYEPFTGKIDGNGFRITDLNIDRSTEENVGLFGSVNGGVIVNLALEKVDIVGRSGVGGIAGRMTEGTLVSNSYTTGNVSSLGVFSGGIVGQAAQGSVITNSYSSANINTASFSAGNNAAPGPGPSGGIAGSLVDSTVSNSYSAGRITTMNPAGGIAGLMSGSTIINSYSTGNVNAMNGPAGGIAGRAPSGTIINCYSTGMINMPVIIGGQTSSAGGGIVGDIVGGNVALPPMTIKNCAAINPAINASYVAGRIIGGIQGVHNFSVQNNFALETMFAGGAAKFSNDSDARFHGFSKSDAMLKDQSTYSGDAVGGKDGGLGWKFGNDDDAPWKMPDGGGYPILFWQ